MPAIAPILAQTDKSFWVRKTVSIAILRLTVLLLICCLVGQGALADTITYQQLRHDLGGRAYTSAPIPASARTNDPGQNPQGSALRTPPPPLRESSTNPEFVRLPDGRIVRYGPSLICDENCVEPVSPAAFRESGSNLWWYITPLVAGGILCAILCRPSRDSSPQASPTINIPVPNPTVIHGQPTPSPGISPTPPPPTEVPEPSTLVLLGLGLGALLVRRRRAQK
jgi:PEP-CTERM motif